MIPWTKIIMKKGILLAIIVFVNCIGSAVTTAIVNTKDAIAQSDKLLLSWLTITPVIITVFITLGLFLVLLYDCLHDFKKYELNKRLKELL